GLRRVFCLKYPLSIMRFAPDRAERRNRVRARTLHAGSIERRAIRPRRARAIRPVIARTVTIPVTVTIIVTIAITRVPIIARIATIIAIIAAAVIDNAGADIAAARIIGIVTIAIIAFGHATAECKARSA